VSSVCRLSVRYERYVITFSGHAGAQTGLEATVAARVASPRVNNTVLTTLTDVRSVFRQTTTKELLHDKSHHNNWNLYLPFSPYMLMRRYTPQSILLLSLQLLQTESIFITSIYSLFL